MKRAIIAGQTAGAIVLFVAACLLWFRGRSGVDELSLVHDRYLANGRAASSAIVVTNDYRLWLNLSAGSVPPYDGQLVWGYHINADKSTGMPRFQLKSNRYVSDMTTRNLFLSESDGRWPTDETAMLGWGPLRWQFFRRLGGGECYWSITIGLSHWLIAMLLLVPITLGLQLLRRYGNQV